MVDIVKNLSFTTILTRKWYEAVPNTVNVDILHTSVFLSLVFKADQIKL